MSETKSGTFGVAIAHVQSPFQDMRPGHVIVGYVGEDQGRGDGGRIAVPPYAGDPPELEPDEA